MTTHKNSTTSTQYGDSGCDDQENQKQQKQQQACNENFSPIPKLSRHMSRSVKAYVRRISSHNLELYPDWNLSKPLPRLPVPPLRHTLKCYLQALKPIVSESQFEETQKIVEEFLPNTLNDDAENSDKLKKEDVKNMEENFNNFDLCNMQDSEALDKVCTTTELQIEHSVGSILQRQLQEFAVQKENWAADWWLEDMYLSNRAPLPINSNPGMVFPPHIFKNELEHLRFAAQLVAGILDYKAVLDSRSLPPERATHHQKGQPLCMEQYYRMFTSYRYPGHKVDRLATDMDKQSDGAEYIVVCVLDQFFSLEVSSTHGSHFSEQELYNQLRRIVRMAVEKGRPPPNRRIGALTSMNRDQWYFARQYLLKSEVNKKSLEVIEKCAFILCLDKSVQPLDDVLPETPTYEGHMMRHNSLEQAMTDIRLSSQMLHGMGSERFACNRWFDKTMQFIVSEDGSCGLNVEHSVVEGIAVIKLIEHILKYMEEMKEQRKVRCSSICELPPPTILHWQLDDVVSENFILKGIQQIDFLIENLDLLIMRYNKFGRDFPKQVNMSPDSFIQLALQLAHFKTHGYLVSTYESASIRRFHLGRVDNIRAASLVALKWCQTMSDKQATDREKILTLRLAMEWQTHIMLQNILGHGIDNHLMGLRRIAENLFTEVPRIFVDPSYKIANEFRLSTSQIPTTMDTFISYGAVVPNGYGAAYNPHEDNIVISISCWKQKDGNEPTQAIAFAEALREAFDEMHQLLSENPQIARQSCNYFHEVNDYRVFDEPSPSYLDCLMRRMHNVGTKCD